jgi:two-component system chemotaxis response regulator CheB
MSLAPAPAAVPKKPPNAVRVMVVDDSVVVRGLVSRWLEEDEGIAVVASARNGRQAVDDIAKAEPDVVVLDIEMPEMDGLTALPLLLKARPGVAVVMASTLTRRNAEISLKALSLGARDYVPKPEGNSGVATSHDFRREIVEKVKALGAAGRDRRLRSGAATPSATQSAVASMRAAVGTAFAKPAPLETKHPSTFALRPVSAVPPRVLAIGSSTGGPQALMEVLKHLGPVFQRVPVLVTQHMPPTFTAILAEHLTRATNVPAAEAKDGEAPRPGRILVAPGGLHMTLVKGADGPHVRLVDGPPVNFCKPAVDPLFESVAAVYGASTLALVLTGMGADGAKGGVIVASSGGTVLAQDEATSVVWGMPGATAQAGACAAVLPLPNIAPKILQLFAATR